MRIVHWIRALIAVLSLAAVFNSINCQHFNDTLFPNIRTKRSAKKHPYESWYDSYYKPDVPLPQAGKLLTLRQNRMLLREEVRNRTTGAVGGGVDCCPSVLEMVEPAGGKNQDDQYVELYRDGNNRQRFYELSCHQDILDKPCRFMDKKLHNNSRCIQKYSYTYALVKDSGGRRHHHHHHNHHHQRAGSFSAFPPSSSSVDGGGGGGGTGTGGSTPGGTGGDSESDGRFRWTLDYIRVRSGCSCVVEPHTGAGAAAAAILSGGGQGGGGAARKKATHRSKSRVRHDTVTEQLPDD